MTTEHTEPTAEIAALGQALGGIPAPCQTTDADAWYEGDPDTAARTCLRDCHALAECAAYTAAVAPRYGVWAGHDYERRGRQNPRREAAS